MYIYIEKKHYIVFSFVSRCLIDSWDRKEIVVITNYIFYSDSYDE